MAGPIKLTEVDFEQIKTNLVDYLKSTKQFTDYDFAGSNLQVILNLISYQAQLNAYTANMVANESFLASASLRDNVVENANMLGYVPTSTRSSVTHLDFEFRLNATDFPQGFPEYLEVRPGPVAFTGSSTGTFTFNLLDVQVAAIVSSAGVCKFHSIKATEGVKSRAVFNVDKSEYNQKFILDNPNIDLTTVRVEVQETLDQDVVYNYKKANNLTTLTKESRVYWIEEIRDGKYELTFGDGFFGKKLEDGAKILITYLVSSGPLGNNLQGLEEFTFVGQTYDSFGIPVKARGVITKSEMTNSGSEIESVSSIKFRAPKSYATQKRCVTAQDYENIIRELFPAVEDIYVFGGERMAIPEFGRVYVVIKPTTGDAVSTITKNYLKKSLEPFRIGSLDIKFIDPDVINVEVSSTVYYDEAKTTKDSGSIISAVKDTLESYKMSSTVSKFGGVVRFSSIVSMIDDSDPSITRNNTSLIMRKDVKPLMNTAASYEMCFLNEFVRDCDNPVIRSSGFQLEINGVVDERMFYFEDDTKGGIRTYFFTADNRKVIDEAEFGTVDYEKGEIRLGYQNPVKIVNVDNEHSLVFVRVIPKSQDVVATETLFLSLDISESPIGAAPDNNIAKLQ